MTHTPTAIAHYGVIGHPVAHSRSPWIHARFAEQTRQRLQYLAIDSPPDAFVAILLALRAEGYQGANVTVPFKLEAFALAKVRSARAELAQAANTLYWQEDVLHADNTDGAGLMRDLVHNAGQPLAGKQVLLLGAGGASAGVLGALLAERPAGVTVANRSLDKAQALVQRHADWAQQHGVALSCATLEQVLNATAALPAYDVVLNGTASSLSGQPLLLPATRFAPDALACDMMYGAAARPFLAHAAACGARTRDGLGMLVEQAALAFSLWRGVTPDTAPVLATLRQLVDAPEQQI